MARQNGFTIVYAIWPSHLRSVHKRWIDNLLVLTTPIEINEKKRSIQTTLLNHDIRSAEVSMHPPSLVHLLQKPLNVFFENGIRETGENFLAAVNKAVETNILLSDVIHDNHVKATRKTLDAMELGSMSFYGAKPMNVLAVLMREFDTDRLLSSSRVEITKENIVVFGCEL